MNSTQCFLETRKFGFARFEIDTRKTLQLMSKIKILKQKRFFSSELLIFMAILWLLNAIHESNIK